MWDSFRTVQKEVNKKIDQSTFKRGVINKVYTDSSTADVIIIGNSQTILKSVPLSSAIDTSGIKVGDRCRIDMFDESNPADSVVAYIYGRSKSTGGRVFFSASQSVTAASGASVISIAHGLIKTPDFAVIVPKTYPVSGSVVGAGPSISGEADTFYLDSVDTTNINIKPTSGGSYPRTQNVTIVAVII